MLAVGNGKETLNAIALESFDLVWMDGQMPEMDGFESTAAIRGMEEATGGHVPIVAITAHARKLGAGTAGCVVTGLL